MILLRQKTYAVKHLAEGAKRGVGGIEDFVEKTAKQLRAVKGRVSEETYNKMVENRADKLFRAVYDAQSAPLTRKGAKKLIEQGGLKKKVTAGLGLKNPGGSTSYLPSSR